MAEDKEQRKEFLFYNIVERGSDQKYPGWVDARPNLHTYLDAINLSQPIIGSQFEIVWSRWPRTLFFAKNITIPGVSVNTIDVNHAGFNIAIPTHVTYENTEISMNIIADKEGFHYYDLRNMVLQSGHPLVAGDPRATIGGVYGVSNTEDVIEVRLRNTPDDATHHHWIIHNFHPTGIGDMELSVDGSAFMEFELKGTFTHITYDCGSGGLVDNSPDYDKEKKTPDEEAAEEEAKKQDEDEKEPEDDFDEDYEEPDDEDYEDEYPDDEENPDDEDEEEEPEDEEDPGLGKGSMVLNGAEMNQTANTPNGGTVQIQGSIPSSVKFGNDRDEDPSPEEQELAKDTASKLNDAGNELQKKLQDIMNMPSSDNPDDQDKEESWVPSPSDEEKPEKSFLDKLKDAFGGSNEP